MSITLEGCLYNTCEKKQTYIHVFITNATELISTPLLSSVKFKENITRSMKKNGPTVW